MFELFFIPIDSYLSNACLFYYVFFFLLPFRYMVYYFPSDLFYKCFCFLPLRVIAAAMKEVTRTWKIVAGVVQAQSRFKDVLLVMVANGWAKGDNLAKHI